MSSGNVWVSEIGSIWWRQGVSGRSSRSSHSGILRLDDSASPSEIPVLRVSDRVFRDSGVWWVSGSLVGPTDNLTPHSPHFLTDSSNETHAESGAPVVLPAPHAGGVSRNPLVSTHPLIPHFPNSEGNCELSTGTKWTPIPRNSYQTFPVRTIVHGNRPMRNLTATLCLTLTLLLGSAGMSWSSLNRFL